MGKSIIQQKSRDFAIRIIKYYRYLTDQQHEMVMSKQLLRCGTSIGANSRESKNAQSRMDFQSIHSDCVELVKMLTAAIKKLKE